MASGDEGHEENRAPLVDVVEVGALLAVPAAGLAAVAALAGGEPVVGLVFGAIVGSFLGTIRRSLYAVRTPEGIERRLRRYGEESAGTDDEESAWSVWARLTDAEYDPRYDLVVAAVCALVGVGALVAVVAFADDAFVARWLLALALFGMVGALGAVGSYSLRSGA